MNDEAKLDRLAKLAALMRYYILASTTEAGSGHPTSSLSGVELMAALVFGGAFRYDVDRPEHPDNDRLIFSKGHASPLLYSIWAAAGKISAEEIMSFRKFDSLFEGHPSVAVPYVEAATGSLGQGLSIGLGMALNARYLDKLPYRTYVLLGDSEMAEGSQWEAIQIAAHYELDNLIGILDVNRLGQRGETMYGHDLHAYQARIASFGWETIPVDGHSLAALLEAYDRALHVTGKPVMIIAKTIKGKGVSFIEDMPGWHGKPLDREQYLRAVQELGEIDRSMIGEIEKPDNLKPSVVEPRAAGKPDYPPDKPFATRMAYGKALVRIYPRYPDIVSLDGEVSNSTGAEEFKNSFPQRFFEMYIAEQNMAGVALGLARRGKIPFVSTFAAFFTRAFDQIRMGRYSEAGIKYVGSHAGVSIGEDGPSQMGLEDIAMFRTLLDSVVLYPSDAVSTDRLVEEAAGHKGTVYIRTTRAATLIIYSPEERFFIGGSKVLRESDKDAVTVVAAGITLHEALKTHETLKKEGISIRVIDLYSIKPIDRSTLEDAARVTKHIITVEDHYAEGGLGEAVRSALADVPIPVHLLAVRKKPRSGKPGELLDYEEISERAIVAKVKELV